MVALLFDLHGISRQDCYQQQQLITRKVLRNSLNQVLSISVRGLYEAKSNDGEMALMTTNTATIF